MQNPSSPEQQGHDEQLDKLRTLILGQENHLVTDSVKKEARKIVADVLSEALHDRQQGDGSVNKVLQPLVEESVEQSVAHNSERLVSSLYPLVGSLVRKSVSAFLADFMEKTNELLENSLTYKGLKWRIKAWQAGVSYAQYAASQTFVYRVEHVFLIHRETGLLLNAIDVNNTGKSDADLISSMLTAINDFVGDSFTANEDGLKEQLQSVSTDNFNLLIKPGPSAIVVAAVIGTPPQKLNDQLQLTLENIHRLFIDELKSFEGDNQPFDNAENLLRDCLLSQQKDEEVANKKPVFAWVLVLIASIYAAISIFDWYQHNQLTLQLAKLSHQPGIIINQISINDDNQVVLEALRDPDAVNINDWLQNNAFDTSQFLINEYQFRSLEPEILLSRALRLLSPYPTINHKWENDALKLSGSLDVINKEQLINKLSYSGFVVGKNLFANDIKSIPLAPRLNTNTTKQQLFNQLIGRISAIQLNFTIASDEVSPQMQLALRRLYQYIQQLELLATELNINFGLLVMGSSDISGVKAANDQLSIKRAQNTASLLENLGVNRDKIYVTGLGQIDITDVKDAARKVMFNIIFVSKNNSEEINTAL